MHDRWPGEGIVTTIVSLGALYDEASFASPTPPGFALLELATTKHESWHLQRCHANVSHIDGLIGSECSDVDGWQAGKGIAKTSNLDQLVASEIHRRQTAFIRDGIARRVKPSQAGLSAWDDARLLAVARVIKGDHKPFMLTDFKRGMHARDVALYSKDALGGGRISGDVLLLWFDPSAPEAGLRGSAVIKRSTSKGMPAVSTCDSFSMLTSLHIKVKNRVR